MSVRIVTVIAIFKLLCIGILLSLLFIFLFVKINNGIWLGFQEGILDAINISDNFTAYQFGKIAGSLIIPTILIVMSLIFIKKHKYIPLLVVLVFQVLFSLSGSTFNSFLSIIMLLIVIFGKNAKSHLKSSINSIGV
jgi:putative copper export protein